MTLAKRAGSGQPSKVIFDRVSAASSSWYHPFLAAISVFKPRACNLLVERVPMDPRRDDDGGAACAESGSDQLAEAIDQRLILRIELNGVSTVLTVTPSGPRSERDGVGDGRIR